jgi:hypothetical protein
MKSHIRPLLLSLLIASLNALNAQPASGQTTLEGTVVSAETGTPIGGAVVRVPALDRRTYTSHTGRFRLPVPSGTLTVAVSSLGFRDSTFSVNPASSPVTLALRPAAIPLHEVTVVAEMSADEVVRRAIDKKEENVAKAKTVQGLLYSKTILSAEGTGFGIGAQDRDAIFETFSRAYYKDDSARFIVVQRRQTANIPPDQNLVALGNFISFYSDDIHLFNTTIPSPLNGSTLSRYDFSIRDRSMLNGQLVYVIDVKPATRLLPAFEGTISIASKTFDLVEVDLRPSKNTAITFIKDLAFHQKFEKFPNDIWQPTFLEVTGKGNVEVVKGLLEVQAGIKVTSIFTELRVNEPIPDSIFATRRLIAAAPNADSARPEFWEHNALSEQTEEEKAIYKKVDSTVAADSAKARQPVERASSLGIGPYIDFNRVGRSSLPVPPPSESCRRIGR